jgi:hypothetical protein
MSHTSHLEVKFCVQKLQSNMGNYIWTTAFLENSQKLMFFTYIFVLGRWYCKGSCWKFDSL